MSTHIRVSLVAALIVFLLSTADALAQTTSLRGRITDPQGWAVVDATITITGPGLSSPRTLRTGADGAFVIDGVSSGVYTLHVDAAGFEPLDRTLTVPIGADTPVLVLQIAGISESVAVAAPKLEEELPQEIQRSGARVQTITSAQIENGGYYDVAQALQALVPGLFLTPKAGPFDYVTASLEGSRTNEILWLVDGVRISNRLYNGTTPLDTIPAHMVERRGAVV